MTSQLGHKIRDICTRTPWRAAVTRYLISFLAILAMAWGVPLTGLADNAGLLIFATLLVCAWYLGVGPSIISPILLIAIFHFRERGITGLWTFTPKEMLDLGVITCFTTAVGISGVLLRRSQAVAKARAQMLLEQDQRKDEFLATLAHELRNPLAPIRTGLELLRLMAKQSQESENVREVHQMMQRQVDHMVRLIDDLLDVSRINTGKIEIQREVLPLSEVINDAVESSRPHIDGARHQLTVTIPQHPVLIEVDRARISQVLMNLLNNAAKFTEPGGQIWLEARLDGHLVEIKVRDNGIGIPADVLPRVFDLFVQADSILTRAQGGLGIGLSLARTLVELHGGTIAASSAGTGKGSEFVLHLPVQVRSGGIDTTSLSDRLASINRRILIIDDNQDAAKSLALMLSAEGHVCELAFDGTSALQLATAFRPEVFLVDIGMPGMSGFDVAAALRASHEFKTSCLIAITGWGQPADRHKCLAAGFDQHLVKPVKFADLSHLLNSR